MIWVLNIVVVACGRLDVIVWVDVCVAKSVVINARGVNIDICVVNTVVVEAGIVYVVV